MSANGRPALPLEEKRKRGTLRSDRFPPAGLTEVERLPEEAGNPEPPSTLGAEGREFWCSVFDNGRWLWTGVDRHLVALTGELMDERRELRELTDQQPENTRLRAALRQLDKQVVSNQSLLGVTPSDRSRLGLVEVKAKTKLEELMERRASRDERLREHPGS
jgi:hypothetical protein